VEIEFAGRRMIPLLSIAPCIVFLLLLSSELLQQVKAEKKNVLIGYAVGYHKEVIHRYIKSFLKYTTPLDDVVVFASIAVDASAYTRPDNVQIIKISGNKYGRKTSHYMRFAEIYSFLLSTNQNYTKVISTDVRDVFFQDNPFDQINASMGVLIFNEPDLLFHNPWNQGWIGAWYGQELVQTLISQNFTVINVSHG